MKIRKIGKTLVAALLFAALLPVPGRTVLADETEPLTAIEVSADSRDDGAGTVTEAAPKEAEDREESDAAAAGGENPEHRVKLLEDTAHLTKVKFGEKASGDGTFRISCRTKEKNVDKVQISVWNDGDSYPFVYTASKSGKDIYTVKGSVRRHGFFCGNYHAKAVVYRIGDGAVQQAVQSAQADADIRPGGLLYSVPELGRSRREICLAGLADAEKVEFSTRCKTEIPDIYGDAASGESDGETPEEESLPDGSGQEGTGEGDGEAAGSTVSAFGEKSEDGTWRISVDRQDYPKDGLYVTDAYAVNGGDKKLVGSTCYYLRDSVRGEVEVPELLQLPELPTGCEAVSLTIDLLSMGFSLDKTTIAEDYLPYGDNMACAYVGSPFTEEGAGVYPPGIVKAANAYLRAQNSNRKAVDISGASMEELCGYIDQGTPVLVWHSMYMEPVEKEGETSAFEGKTYPWFITEHCVVLCGYDKERGTVTVSDPLEGKIERDADAFTSIYDDVGQYAVVIQ